MCEDWWEPPLSQKNMFRSSIYGCIPSTCPLKIHFLSNYLLDMLRSDTFGLTLGDQEMTNRRKTPQMIPDIPVWEGAMRRGIRENLSQVWTNDWWMGDGSDGSIWMSMASFVAQHFHSFPENVYSLSHAFPLYRTHRPFAYSGITVSLLCCWFSCSRCCCGGVGYSCSAESLESFICSTFSGLFWVYSLLTLVVYWSTANAQFPLGQMVNHL